MDQEHRIPDKKFSNALPVKQTTRCGSLFEIFSSMVISKDLRLRTERIKSEIERTNEQIRAS